MVVTTAATLAALVLPISTRPSYVPLHEGGVAPQDIQAPYALEFVSKVFTDQAITDAVLRVAAVYTPTDPAIARQQIENLRAVLNYINSVRADSYANQEQKIEDLGKMQSLQLPYDDAVRVLTISEARWLVIQQESLTVLEQVMRNTIQEGRVEEARRGVPTLISLTLPQDQAQTVAQMITPFVVANSLYSQAQTETARQAAREAVQPVTRTFASGEIIVRRGQIITSPNWEALEAYRMIESPDQSLEVAASLALVLAMACFVTLYFYRRKPPVISNLRSLLVISITFLLFLYLSRLIIPNRMVMPYLFPIPAFGLTIAVLFHAELAMVLTLVLSVLAAYGLPNSLDLTIYYTVSSLFGILVLGRGQRLGSFFTSGLGVGAAGAVVIIAYRMQDSYTDLMGLTTLIGAVLFNGIASSSLTLVLQFFYSQILGLATALQLLDISRPDHPLQQFLLQNAPGSYQHSLQVAIMAEQAAEKIGADSLLVRVGAIYHDSGKALNPSFFIENQVPGKLNPHDDLDPLVSAHTIIRHVTDGVQLARKYRMPHAIIDFMLEHHGNLVTRYQYAKAIEAAGGDKDQVDLNNFRYPGPRPQSRETALIMLADGTQARARAELPSEEFEMRAIVRKVIDFCQHEGQLDDTHLTLRDLNAVAESFVTTLQNTYHPRIRYPEIKTASEIITTPETIAIPETTAAALIDPEPTQPVENLTSTE